MSPYKGIHSQGHREGEGGGEAEGATWPGPQIY